MTNTTTFAMIKPDGMAHNIAPHIKRMFSENHLNIVESRVIYPTRAQAALHYGDVDAYIASMGKKVIKTFALFGKNIDDSFLRGCSAHEIGVLYHGLSLDYLTSGPVEAMILMGPDVLLRTRRLCGDTFPEQADKETIRGMYGIDTFEKCIQERRMIHNIVHSAEDESEGLRQIAVWFPKRLPS